MANYSDERLDQIWDKGQTIRGKNPDLYRQDKYGNTMYKHLVTGVKNIGKVFNLDVITMIDVLHEAEKTGAIKIIRTAGLDIIRIEHRYTFEECVDKFYESIERNRR